MDSGNSGSLQSSSGGDEEFDTRTESISSFLNSSAFNQPLPTAAPPAQQQQQQNNHHHQLLSHHHHQGGNNNFFGQNLDPFQSLPGHFAQQNHNQQNQNHDLLWSRSLRPDSGNHGVHFGGINPQSVLNNAQLTQQQTLPPQQPPSSHLPADANAATKGGGGGGGENNHQPLTAVKNPKKRTRASRRAPTTVLTTDTSNFRQMVQEFTGIPTAPFSGAGGSPYSRGRLDLFSTGTSNMGPLYPLRPSAQKAHHQNFIDSANPQNHLLNNMQQNHILSFNPNNPNSNPNPNPINHNNIPSFLLAGKNPGMNNVSSNNSSSLPSYDELGLGQNAVGAHVSSGLWRDSGATAAHVSSYTAAPEFLQHEKGNLENVASGGGEGVGSWICPSD